MKEKNRTLKCLKRQYSTVRLVENVAVLTEDGICPLFFVPTQGDLTAQESPPPGIYHPRPKWWGRGGGWVQLEYFSVNFGHGPGGSL